MIKAIRDRYSVRSFKDQPIESEKLNEILEAARFAPSSRNIQPWHFVVIEDSEMRKQLTDICKGQNFVAQAPLTIAICVNNYDYTMACGERAAIVDAAIAGEHIALQAADLGIGSCWIGAFYQDEIRQLLDLPADYRVIGLLPLGYPTQQKRERTLKPLSEIVSYNRFADHRRADES
ncbi:MAG: nitroreductase family protein [Candidatus Cloacimonetes bacterium]|nr:nitroreductase family protein [Candidatus Cloacimonadota bacterium]